MTIEQWAFTLVTGQDDSGFGGASLDDWEDEDREYWAGHIEGSLEFFRPSDEFTEDEIASIDIEKVLDAIEYIKEIIDADEGVGTHEWITTYRSLND